MADDDLTSFCQWCKNPTFTFGANKKAFCIKCEDRIRLWTHAGVVLLKIGFWIVVIVMLWKILQK